MSEPLLTRVSREGKELGSYPAPEVLSMLKEGEFLPTDFYWHEGMACWTPLSRLQSAGPQFQLEGKDLKEKEEKAARLRAQIEGRKNHFTCNCCKATFDKPNDPRKFFWKGILSIFLSWSAGAVAMGFTSNNYIKSSLLFFLAFGIVSAVIAIQGFALILSSALRSPYCPGCHSTNYSRPNNGERPVFD